MQVKQIIKLLNEKFPLSKAVKHDKVGLQIGKKKWEVNKILVALDLTSLVLTEAINNNCQLIIVHHPFFFYSRKTELKITYKKEIYKKLLDKQISVFVTHTSYDQQMNLEILKELKVKNIQDLISHDVGKIGILKSEDISLVITRLQKIFNISDYTINMELPLEINNIALCLGAGGSLLKKLTLPIDLFVTGELKWNEWIMATEKNIPVICFNHSMENYYLISYLKILQQVLPNNIKILVTKNKMELTYKN